MGLGGGGGGGGANIYGINVHAYPFQHYDDGGKTARTSPNRPLNLPIKAANFLELDGGKQHFKLKEPNLVRVTSQGFSQ